MNGKEFEPIRIRIMQEAYELADRGDAEGYNSVKVMCNDVQNLLRKEWVDLDIKEVDPLCEKYRDQPYKLYVEIRNLLKERNT